MLLVIDVGNTDTKLGFFKRGLRRHAGELTKTWRVTTAHRRTGDEYGVLFAAMFRRAEIPLEAVTAIVVASVVPQTDRPLREACRRYFSCEPFPFVPARQDLMAIRTDRPADVGADLVAAAIGARSRFGTPAIVIGFGTATTYCAVASDGAFVGAAIAPGVQIALDALAARTAKLPQVALDAPPHAIGTDTVSALQSGVVFGTVGQTEGIVARMRAELGGEAHVIATGAWPT